MFQCYTDAVCSCSTDNKIQVLYDTGPFHRLAHNIPYKKENFSHFSLPKRLCLSRNYGMVHAPVYQEE